MKKASTNKPRKFASRRRAQRARSVASASGLALILGLVNAAVGASLTISVPASTTAVGQLAITPTAPFSLEAPQLQTATVDASIINSIVGATTTLPGPGQLGGTVTISTNELLATAISNSAVQTATSGLLLQPTEDFSIATAQATQLVSGNKVTAAVLSSPQVIGFSNGTNTVTGNTTQASVTLNTSTASVDHDFLPGFDTPTQGAIHIDGQTQPNTIVADANGVIANFQQARNSGVKTGSGARVEDSGIEVNDTTVAMAPSDTITVSGNQIGASYQANDASSAYTGTGGDFEGSIAIANSQRNQEGNASSTASAAAVTGSGIAVDTGAFPIAGDVTITRNGTAADTTGNRVANSLMLDATTITGDDSTPSAVLTLLSNKGSKADVTGANAAIASTQFHSQTRLASTIDTSDITVFGTGGAGTIAVTQNQSAAAATGNDAQNVLSLNAAGASGIQGASAVIANAQNVHGQFTPTQISASNHTSIQVAGTSTTPLADQTGAIVLAQNTIDSAAVGSAADNQLSLQSSTGIQSSANGPAFVTGNSQEAGEMTVAAQTQGNVEALLDDTSDAGVDVTVSQNTLSSSARSELASNVTSIESASGTYGSSIDNKQNMGRNTDRTAATGSDLVGVDIAGAPAGLAGSSLVVSDNQLTALAQGNGADNELRNTATAGLSSAGTTTQLINFQQAGGNTTADTGNALIALNPPSTLVGIRATGRLAGDNQVLGNLLDARAVTNQASNTVALSAGTDLSLAQAGAVLQSTQQNSTGGQTTARTQGLIGILAGPDSSTPGDVTVTGGTVNDNQLSSSASANEASSALSLAGTNVSLQLPAATAALSNEQKAGSPASAQTVGSFGVQASNAIGTNTLDGTTTVSGNRASAQALGNQTRNTSIVAATTGLNTSAGGLSNKQTASAAVTATTQAGAGIRAADASVANVITGTTSVLGNQLLATAIGNDAGMLDSSGGTGGGTDRINALSWSAGTALSATQGPALSSLQQAESPVTANVAGDFGIQASGTGASVANTIEGDTTVAGNQAAAQATGNQAVNLLALAAGTDLSTPDGVSLGNVQRAQASVQAGANVDIGITAEGGGTANTVRGSSNVLDNVSGAAASGNLVDNVLQLSGGSLDAGTGAKLTNAQTATAAVTANTVGGIGIVAKLGGPNSSNTLAGSNTVSGNQMNADAIGNQAGNLISLAADTTLDAGSNTLLSSNQSSTGNVGAASAGNIGLQASGAFAVGSSSITGQTSMLDNAYHAQAGQNAAANQIQLQGGALSGAALGINSIQAAGGTTTAQVYTNADIVGIMATGASGSPVSLSGDATLKGNVMESIAQANAASNTLVFDTASAGGPLALSLSNRQTNNGASTASTSLTSGLALFSDQTLGDASSHSVVEGNRLSAQAGGNQADNTLAVTTDTSLAGIGGNGLVSQQDSNAPVSATTAGVVAIQAGGLSGPGSTSAVAGDTTVSGNQVLSQAIGNQVQNRYALQSGTDLANTAAQTLKNTQNSVAEVSASTQASAGVFARGASTANTIEGQSAVLDNTLSSLATGNLATNALTLTAGTTLDASLAGPSLSSTQTAASVSASSTPVGALGIKVLDVATSNRIGSTGDSATVSGNRISAQATGNQADNTLALTAGTTLSIPSAHADLRNTQTANGPVSATASGQVGIEARDGSASNTIGALGNVLANAVSADAAGNVATNTVSLQAGVLNAEFGPRLFNTQTSVGAVAASSQADITIRAQGTASDSSLAGGMTVSGNEISADAIGNRASNALGLSADTTLRAGSDTQPARMLKLDTRQTGSGNVTADAGGDVGLQAIGANASIAGPASVLDNRVQARAGQNEAVNTLALNAGTELIGGAVTLANTQTATADTTRATVTSTQPIGILVAGTNTLAGFTGVATVKGNTLQSVAFANSASNLLTPTAATGNQGSATINNTQTNGTAGGSTGAVTANTTLSDGLGVYATGPLNLGANSVITVAGNQVQASAYGNSASNVLNADGGVGMPGATLAGLNTQSNYGVINATVSGPATSPAIGLATGAAASPSYTANVLGNAVASTAYGNTAYNQLQASSSVGMVPTAASLVSTQMNGAAVTALVSNMGVGVVASGSGTGTGTSVISGNTLSSLAVGNASVSHLVIGN